MKNRDTNYVQELDVNHPWHKQRITSINTLNQIVESIKENRKYIYSKIEFFTSIILAIFLAIFAGRLNLPIILIILNSILIFLIVSAKKYYFTRIDLAKCKKDTIKNLKRLGINIRKPKE